MRTVVSGVGSLIAARPSSRAVESQQSIAKKTAEQRAADEQRLAAQMSGVVQKKSTPCRKPRNSGGSPSGVSEPPMLETRKMKNTTTWAL